MSRLVAVVLMSLVLGVVAAPHARGAEISFEQLRELAAAAAAGDDAALVELRAVDAVDGRPFEVGRALEGAEGAALLDRLRLLAGDSGEGGEDAAVVRAEAREILSGSRFEDSGVGARQGTSLIRRALTFVGDLLSRMLAGPGSGLGWWIGAVLVVALLVGVAAPTLRRTAAGPERGRRRRQPGEATLPSADELDGRADAAVSAGDYAGSVRLRFRAGMVRLDEKGVMRLDRSFTSSQISSRLRLAEFDGLAAGFDRIVYGGVEATAADADEARVGWRTVTAAAVQR